MKTVSTKLDNNLHSRFIEICNEDGKCQSEFLRDLIETVCEDVGEGNILHIEEAEPTPELPPDDIERKPVQQVRIRYS